MLHMNRLLLVQLPLTPTSPLFLMEILSIYSFLVYIHLSRTQLWHKTRATFTDISDGHKYTHVLHEVDCYLIRFYFSIKRSTNVLITESNRSIAHAQ
jgi:hypothetical protein